MEKVRENVHVIDNVTVILTDIHTGVERIFTDHNFPLDYCFQALAAWFAGVNNSGYQPTAPPTQIQYGSGSGTPQHTDPGLFTPISGSLTNLSYSQPNQPQSGTSTLVFQTAAGVVTTQVTEAFLRDTNGNGFGHTMFSVPFTPTSTETITTKWEFTFSQ